MVQVGFPSKHSSKAELRTERTHMFEYQGDVQDFGLSFARLSLFVSFSLSLSLS